MSDLRYPIGKHDVLAPVSRDDVGGAIRDLEELPMRLSRAVEGLDEGGLEMPYRPEGWTVRQVVHHLADSHVNAYARLRLALTETEPVIRPYDEQRWAELEDAKHLGIMPSIELLGHLHARWTHLLRSLDPRDFDRRLVHPESGTFSVAQLTCMYGWHSRHHVAHIVALRERMKR